MKRFYKITKSDARTLDIRAVGLYPERFAVDVIANAPPIEVAMNTMRTVLDTISIRAVRGRLRGFLAWAQLRLNCAPAARG